MGASGKITKHVIVLLLAGLLLGQPGLGQAAHPAEPGATCNPTVQSQINSAPAGGTVNLPACTNNESLVVAKDLTIQGDSNGGTILTGPAVAPVVTLNGVHLLKLKNLEITGGSFPGGGGGAVYAQKGSLEILDSYLHHNSAAYGGAIFQGVVTSTLTVTGSRIEQNSASVHGGGIYSAGSLSLTNTDFISNTAAIHGGGVNVASGNTSIMGGIFSGNTAGLNGGGVNLNNGLTVQGATFTNNKAGDSGGAITQWNKDFQIAISWSTFQGNQAKNYGGGVYVNSVVTFDHDTFDGNVVDSKGTGDAYGGGVYAGNSGKVIATSVVTVLDSTFANNKAKCTGCISTRGGGLYVEGVQIPGWGAVTTVRRSTFNGNNAWSGAGIYPNYQKLIIESSSFTSNSGGYGAGIDAYILEGRDLTFTGNTAGNSGAGFYAYQVTLDRARFLSNSGSGYNGGAVLDFGKQADLSNLLFVNNSGHYSGTIGMNKNARGVLRNITLTQPSQTSSRCIFVSAGTAITLENTIMTGYDTGVAVRGSLTADHNLYYQITTDNILLLPGYVYSDGGYSLFTDPKFVNPTLGDFHLQAGSPAIPGGVYNPGVDVDLDGALRWSGHSAMGAYNYGYYGFAPVVRK